MNIDRAKTVKSSVIRRSRYLSISAEAQDPKSCGTGFQPVKCDEDAAASSGSEPDRYTDTPATHQKGPLETKV